jgi:hypothetical protein
MRTPIATLRLMAGDTPQTGATTTRLVRRGHGHRARRAPLRFARRPSTVARRRVPTSRCLKETETKRRWRLRSARLSLRSSTRASARDHGGEAEFAASDSYRRRHDNHAWCGKFESALHHRLENSAAMPIPALNMARPGLEPGTPRFSVVRSGMAGRTQSLEPCDSPVARAPA